MDLVNQIVPYDMSHNSETECTDLLMEIERLDMLVDAVDQKENINFLCAFKIKLTNVQSILSLDFASLYCIEIVRPKFLMFQCNEN